MRFATLVAGFLLLAGPAAYAASPVTVQDPGNVNLNMTVNADGSINVTCLTGCSGGGGGGAVTIADGADITQGAKADSTCATDGGTCSLAALIKRANTILTLLNTTAGSALAAGANVIGGVTQSGTWTVQAGTGTSCPSTIPISQTTSTDLHTGSGKTYICSIVLIIPDAETVSLVEGTGTVCATGIAAVIGGTTAANGVAPGANGGFSAIGGFPWLQTQTTNDHLCLLQSGSGRIAGVITYNDH